MKTGIRIFIGILLIAVVTAAGAARLVPKAEFTERTVAAIAKAYPDLDVRIEGELEVSYKSRKPGDKIEGKAYFDNAYQQYQNHRDLINDVIARYVDAFGNLGTAKKCDPALVFPTLRSAEYLVSATQLISQESARRGNDPTRQSRFFTERFVGDLSILYVEDNPVSTQSLTVDELDKCRFDRQKIEATAIVNLQRKAADFKLSSVPGAPGLTLVNGDQYYETALLLIDSFWTPERFPAKGDLVVAIPARGWLIVADSSDSGAIAGMAKIAQRAYRNEAYNLTPKLYRRQGGQWREYQP